MSTPSPPFPVGTFLCGGFQGTTVTPQAYHLIVEHHVSSMILSRKNAVSAAQMSKLIKDLQFIAFKQANYKYPIMFAIDEEGGMLNSLFDPDFLTQCPGAMALAATGDTELVYEISKAVATELKHIGFSIILGPVLDVVTKLSHQLMGVRSFGTTIENVTKYGMACAKGLRAGGLLTVGKHFPGIGNATVDSLLELPMISDTLDQIKQSNSVPFAKLIEEDVLDGISAAGCGVPSISPDEIHACLSPTIINQLLRKDLKFQGFVISECLEMEALYHSIGLGQGVVLALSAGCDLVMVCHDLALQNEAIESMQKAIADGTLDDETINAGFQRIEKLQKTLPTWSDLFPRGELSAKEDEIKVFRNEFPELWEKHQKLSSLAYQKSITLVRDANETLPLGKFIAPKKNDDSPPDNILLLTPLLNPIYPSTSTSYLNHQQQNHSSQLFTGEEVFQKFGEYLSDHAIDKANPYNVLHTTYTANGLTPLHESLIENSKVVIILTSEASRNMYQIGIVKYVSILCGANPNSFNNSAVSQLSKPLVIVATSSPYDFFYNKSIGSAYLCCFDYTEQVLQKLAGVLMGDFEAEGCIPGEKKFINKSKRDSHKYASVRSNGSGEISRNSTILNNDVVLSHKDARNKVPKRRWLVDELELKRDWSGLVKLWKNNTLDSPNVASKARGVNYQNDNFYRKLYALLSTHTKSQKHFVVRNSSLNILYGVVLTWVHEQYPLDGDLTKESPPVGSIMYLLVDKSKIFQSIGKSLHARAMRYLLKEKNCKSVTLGTSLPLFVFPNNSNLISQPANNMVKSFMYNLGWDVELESKAVKKYVMVLNNLDKWSVPKKIFRELMIVGVRFDICSDPEKLMKLIDRSIGDSISELEKSKNQKEKDSSASTNISNEELEERERMKSLYLEVIKHLGSSNPFGVKIIIALEPTNQSVIGSIVLFTNRSQLAKFYPFIDEVAGSGSDKNAPLIGGIIGPVIDPSYSNLTEIFKYGLICSGITYLKSNLNDGEIEMNQCMMIGVNDDKSINGVKEIGFSEWDYYYDYYDKKFNPSQTFST